MEELVNEVMDTDVLIIGGGIAGCTAAIEAIEAGMAVTIVDKANIGRGGMSHQMSGVLTCFEPAEDDADKWYEECIEAGQGLCDINRLQGMIEETAERVRDMETWGVHFQKEKGGFIRKAGVGHQYARNIILTDGGFQLMSVLRGEVLRRGVRLVERVMVTELLTSDGEQPTQGNVTGAVGFGVRTGKSYVFKARAVIMAAGCTRAVDISPATMSSLSGDGKAMAFRVGCQMRNIELTFFSPGPTDFMCAPGINILFGEGAIMVNNKGERFMKKWDSTRVERASRSVLCKAMAMEEREGRGPIYLDATHLDDGAYRRIEMALPIVTGSFAKGGLNLGKNKIKYSVRISDLGPGGIRTDQGGATTVPGLYAAGAVSDHGEDGVSNIIGHGMESCIGGYRAGRSAAQFALQKETFHIDEPQLRKLTRQIFAPMTREKGISHHEARRKIKRMGEDGLLGAVRNERNLKKALETVEDVKDLLPDLTAKDYHELTRVHGLNNELLFVELLAKCALYRTESRGSHYREDYPERDDKNWLKWVIVGKEGDDTKIWGESLPSVISND